ncbi:MAG: sigma-70 family RNA polymerase sigma factor [Thermoanaerobaculia bacterium]|nr:sigma-70 family RNA polymerase sigma factor [Thermoanaerobaculia bacterium]
MASSDDPDLTAILRRLTAEGRADAWPDFLRHASPLIIQVIRLFERDDDAVGDCYVFVLERLERDDYRRLRTFEARGAASFSTWLRVVVRNLYLDWRRSVSGRPRPPRPIARLPELEQEIYRRVHERGMSVHECHASLLALFPELTEAEVADALVRIGSLLTSRQHWLLASRDPTVRSLTSGRPGQRLPLDPPDPDADPQAAAAAREEAVLLAEGLERLDPSDRLLLRLRFEQGMSLERLAAVVGLGSGRQAGRRIEELLRELRRYLRGKES